MIEPVQKERIEFSRFRGWAEKPGSERLKTDWNKVKEHHERKLKEIIEAKAFRSGK